MAMVTQLLDLGVRPVYGFFYRWLFKRDDLAAITMLHGRGLFTNAQGFGHTKETTLSTSAEWSPIELRCLHYPSDDPLFGQETPLCYLAPIRTAAMVGAVKCLTFLLDLHRNTADKCSAEDLSFAAWVACRRSQGGAMRLLVANMDLFDINRCAVLNDSGETGNALHGAIGENDTEMVEFLVAERKADVNCPREVIHPIHSAPRKELELPICIAIWRRSPAMLRLLIRLGADVNPPGPRPDYMTPLGAFFKPRSWHGALAERGDFVHAGNALTDGVECFHVLLEAGADPTASLRDFASLMRPEAAVYRPFLMALVKSAPLFDVGSAVDARGRTFLSAAVRMRDHEVADVVAECMSDAEIAAACSGAEAKVALCGPTVYVDSDVDENDADDACTDRALRSDAVTTPSTITYSNYLAMAYATRRLKVVPILLRVDIPLVVSAIQIETIFAAARRTARTNAIDKAEAKGEEGPPEFVLGSRRGAAQSSTAKGKAAISLTPSQLLGPFPMPIPPLAKQRLLLQRGRGDAMSVATATGGAGSSSSTAQSESDYRLAYVPILCAAALQGDAFMVKALVSSEPCLGIFGKGQGPKRLWASLICRAMYEEDGTMGGFGADAVASALCFAAFGGNVEVMETLIEYGADVHYVSPWTGYSPIHYAVIGGYAAGGSAEGTGGAKKNRKARARESKRQKSGATNDEEAAPAAAAAGGGGAECEEAEATAAETTPNPSRANTATTDATVASSSSVRASAYGPRHDRKLAAVRYLLTRAGANVNAETADAEESSPLHLAVLDAYGDYCYGNSISSSSGAPPSPPSYRAVAASSSSSSPEAVEALFSLLITECKADVRLLDNNAHTPFDTAVEVARKRRVSAVAMHNSTKEKEKDASTSCCCSTPPPTTPAADEEEGSAASAVEVVDMAALIARLSGYVPAPPRVATGGGGGADEDGIEAPDFDQLD